MKSPIRNKAGYYYVETEEKQTNLNTQTEFPRNGTSKMEKKILNFIKENCTEVKETQIYGNLRHTVHHENIDSKAKIFW